MAVSATGAATGPVAHPTAALVVGDDVDDSETIRQLMRLYLEAEGYAVEETADGVKASARLSYRETL